MPPANCASRLRQLLGILILAPALLAQPTNPLDKVPFPRIGNIWTGNWLFQTNPSHVNQIGLFLGPGPNPLPPEDAEAIRTANPNVLILTDISATDTSGAVSPPDSYYLLDVNGNRIEDWCGSSPRYILNLTLPAVGQFLAEYAAQTIRSTGNEFDGAFFDSFATTIPQPYLDCRGAWRQIDSNGDGIPDDSVALNAAWAAGSYLAVNTFRRLSPGSLVSGHVQDSSVDSEAFAAFNGGSLVFDAVNVREGILPFGALWDLYRNWESKAVWPAITMVQSSPPNQIAYGYGHDPLDILLPDTLEFARTFYPNMRFGLALALMNDGFFTYDFGDTGSEALVDWWYDEYNFDLGFPLSPAVQVSSDGPNLLTNGGFENGLSGWRLYVDDDGQAAAGLSLDTSAMAEGNASVLVNVASSGNVVWHVELEQGDLPLTAGATYRLRFWARADSPRTITVFSQSTGPNYVSYGLDEHASLTTTWQPFTMSFIAPDTVNDARIEFWVGDQGGRVWIDQVQLSLESGDAYRRDFTNGVVLVNGMNKSQTVALEPGLQRFSGPQAPLYQYIVDDTDPAFSSSGSWNAASYNTCSYSTVGTGPNLPAAPQNSKGPFYHCWQGTCHIQTESGGRAQWNLNIPADGQYTIQVWLPAAPGSSAWTNQALYNVVSGGSVLATATLDQTSAGAGDGWHTIGTVNLTAAAASSLELQNAGAGALVADAVYITSAARFNDGSPASSVTLAPFDGILLQRQQPVPAPAAQVKLAVNSASLQPVISSGAYVSIVGSGFAPTARAWDSSDFSGLNLPTSLSGVSVTINGKPAYVQYVSSTQINAFAPDDPATGPVQVRVTTPQGAGYEVTVLKQAMSPAFFSSMSTFNSSPDGTDYIVAGHQDGTAVGPPGPSSRPAAPGETIDLYGTGFGPTIPATPAGEIVSPALLALTPSVTIGGLRADVHWVAKIWSGLYQFSVTVPAAVSSGNQPVQATIAGFQSPATALLPVASTNDTQDTPAATPAAAN
jgi:uncharacterized protein (TIGR03437 family)